VLAAAAAAATLPWWAPTGTIADYLERELSRAARTEVRIADVSLDWADGLVIEGLTVAPRPDAAEAPLFRAERIRCDVNPVTLLGAGRPGWIDLDGPELRVALADDGTHNLAPLERLAERVSEWPVPPRISISRGRVSVSLPSRRRPLDLNVADAQVVTAEDGTARATISASLAQDGAAAPISAVVRTDAKRRPTDIELTFAWLDLAAGAEALAGRLGRGLRGRCAGKLTATLRGDDTLDRAALALNVTDLADQAGPIADRLSADVAFASVGEDGGHISADLTAPGATGKAKVAFTAGRADLHKLARMEQPLAAASWPHVRSATTGSLAVRVAGPALLERLWPELADEWRRTAGRNMGAALDVTLEPRGKTRVEMSVLLGRAGDASLSAATGDVTALWSDLQALRRGPARQHVRTAMRHVVLRGAVSVSDIPAVTRLVPALADTLADLPVEGAAAAVGIDHVGSSAVTGVGPGHTYLAAEVDAPRHGKVWAEALLPDPEAFWPLAFRALDAPTKANVLACLPAAVIEGGLRVEDFAPVTRIAPELAEALEGLKLNGRAVNGWFALEEDGGLALQADLSIPAGAEWTVAGLFAKPRHAEAALTLDATIVDEATLSDISARLTLGRAAAAITDGRLKLTAPAPGQPGAAAEGRLAVSNLQAWAACLPDAWGMPPDVLRGAARGRFSIALAGGGLRHAGVTADLRDAAIHAGGMFVKPAAQAGRVSLALAPIRGAGGGYGLTVTADVGCAAADVTARLGGLDPERIAREGLVSVTGTVRDAGDLVGRSAALGGALGASRLSGSGSFYGGATWGPDRAEAYLRLDATALALASADRTARSKRPGVPAEIRLFAQGDRSGHEWTLRHADAMLSLGANRIYLGADGAVRLQTIRRDRPGWHDLLRSCNASLIAEASLGPVLLDLVPELADPAKRYHLAGRLTLRAETAGDGDELAAACLVDARALEGKAALAQLARAIGLKGAAAEQLAAMGPIVKSADHPCEAWLIAAVPRSLTYCRLDHLEATIGKLTVTGRGRIGLARAEAGPLVPETAQVHGQVRLPDAADLAALLPALKPYRPRGSVQVDFACTRTDRRDGGALDAVVTLAKLGGRYRGRDVQVNGTVDVIGVSPGAGGAVSVRRVRTDALDVRAAGSGAVLVADLADLPHAASGSVTLLAETIDAVALEQWLSPTGKVAPWPEGRLTPDAAAALRAQADKTAADLARLTAGADVELHVRIARLRARDTIVEEVYDLGQVRLDASVRRGRVRGRYATALNGGLMSGRFAVSLGLPGAVLSARKQLRDVVATKNMAPQMHHFFPGNTPGGTFDRAEDLRWPLRDVLASQVDPRLRLLPTGSAETITTDGVLEARAATGVMAALFPALEEATYRYRKMTAFSTFRPDGTAVNDMIFDGRDYGLYMTGTTDAAGRADYEVGLLAFGALQSHRRQHTHRQGRMPLFRFRALLYRRKFTDVRVDYYWPHQSLGTILLENNILHRMWKRD